MKTSKALVIGATLSFACVINQNAPATDLNSAAALASALVHRLVVASPHGLEEFPSLLREAPPVTETAVGLQRVPPEIANNRALAASPRMKEQFPELARSGWSMTEIHAQPGKGLSALDQVRKNRALAASPRMKEQFPELARGYVSDRTERPSRTVPLTRNSSQ